MTQSADPLLSGMRAYANPDGSDITGPISITSQTANPDGSPVVGPIRVSGPNTAPTATQAPGGQGDFRDPFTGPPGPADDGVGPISARPAPRTELEMAKYNQGLAREREGQALETAGRHAMEQGAQEAATYRQQADAESEGIQRQEKIRADFERRLDEKSNAIRQAQDDLAKKEIDPNRLINNMSGGETVLAAIGILLAGIGGGISGTGRNVALEEIHRRVDADIDSQKADYERGLHRLKGMETDYSMARQRGLDDLEARRVLQSQRLNAVALRLKEAQAQGAGVAKNDQLQSAIADLDGKIANNDLQMAQSVRLQALSQAHGSQMQAQAHRDRMEELLLQGALGVDKAEQKATAAGEKDLEKAVTKYGLEVKKLDAAMDPREIQRIEDAFAKGGNGLSYFGGVKGTFNTEARENRAVAARLAENWLRSKTGAQASDRERETMLKIQLGRATEDEYRDFASRIRGFYEMQREELDKSFDPGVRQRFENNAAGGLQGTKASTGMSEAERVAEARRRLGVK